MREDAERLYAEIHPYAYANDFNWRVGLSQEQTEKTAAGLAAYPNVFPALEQAAQCTKHVWPIDFGNGVREFSESGINFVNQSRNAAILLDCRGRYLCATGQPDEAAQLTYRHFN